MKQNGIREFLDVLLRRKWMLFAIIGVTCALAGGAAVLITPLFSAEALVMVEASEQKIADIKEVLTERVPDRAAEEKVTSEIEVLRSRDLAETIISELRLDLDPEFNAALRPRSWLGAEWTGLRRRMSALWSAGPEPAEDERKSKEKEETLDAFSKRLSVYQVGKAPVIAVRFTSEKPQLASEVANRLVERYLADQLEAKFEAAARATRWLGAKLVELRRAVAVSEQAVEDYRNKAGLLAGTSGLLTAQQISDLNTQLVIARTARAEAEARLKQVDRLLKTPGGAQSAAEVLQSPLIRELLVQEAQVKRKLADLSEEYGDRHPRLISARAELRDLQQKIQGEVSKIAEGLRNEVAVAAAREGALELNLRELKAQVADSNAADVRLRELMREGDANKVLLESFLKRYEETRAQTDPNTYRSDARVIQKARVPFKPSHPSKLLILFAALLGSAATAVGLAFTLEALDRGFRSGDQVENDLGVRTLGLVPETRGLRRASQALRGISRTGVPPLFEGAISSLYTSLMIAGDRAPPKTILITSSQPREGKSTISWSLSRARAIAGNRTVYVEADTRKPKTSRGLGLPQVPGLAEFLRGEAALAKVLHRHEASGTYVLPAGSVNCDPADLLGSSAMDELLATLAREFDLVVIDTPPLCAVPDARILAKKADAVLFVVRWAETNREAVMQGFKYLVEAGGPIAGAVLSRVDPQKHARYSFGDSSLYYAPVRQYYAR